MHLEIVTPEKVVFAGEVSSVRLPGSAGTFEVLKDHAPLISTLDPGDVRVRTESGEVQHFPVGRGFVEVLKNKIIVMV